MYKEMLTFYCIDTWSTCRKAKAWLSQNNIEFEYRNLIKDPLSEKEIKELADMAKLELSGLINKRSQVFKKMAIDLTELDDNGIVRLMGENPRIIIRPLLSDGQKVLQGFNEQDYVEFASWQFFTKESII